MMLTVFGVVGLTQGALAIVLLITAVLVPTMFTRAFTAGEKYFLANKDRPTLHLWIVFLLAVGLRTALLPAFPPPPLIVPDEFSILFQAELMVQGRWAAPSGPTWRHFEEMHLIATPVRAAIYFPGRSFPLVVGLLIAGIPWVGVLLTTAALATAVTWMLQACVRPLIALLGGIIVVMQFGLFSYWMNGYWGGSITALGATLTLGAALRLQNGAGWREGIWAAFGVFLMMTSRPFEGFMFCAGIGLALLPWASRTFSGKQNWELVKFVLPIVAAAAFGGAVLSSHSAAITGHPMKPAYLLGRAQYGGAPAFLMSEPLPRTTWPDAHLAKLYQWETSYHERRDKPLRLLKAFFDKGFLLFAFFIGPALLIPFVLGFFSLGSKVAIPALAGGFVTVGFMATTWDFPHYAAPLLPSVLVFVAAGLARLRTITFQGRSSGLFLARTLPILLPLGLLVPLADRAFGLPVRTENNLNMNCCAIRLTTEREEVARKLKATAGNDIVFVRYDRHSERHAWVYNAPDLRASPIIWVRDLGDKRNQLLMASYPDRLIWLVKPRNGEVETTPYPSDAFLED